jgi:hypothetical protein
MKKPRRNRSKTRRQTKAKSATSLPRTLAALGKSEDAIAHVMGVHKNTLRARHAPDLDEGREIKRAAAETVERKKLSVREQELEDALNAGFDENGNATGYWKSKDGGNLLAHGCKTRKEYDEFLARMAARYADMRGPKMDDEQ